jgi:hypothetical protein
MDLRATSSPQQTFRSGFNTQPAFFGSHTEGDQRQVETSASNNAIGLLI